MNHTSTPVLDLRGLSRRYGRGENVVDALRSVTLQCPAGTWTAVMGPSGSGKSTLLNCAAGLDRPTAGQALVQGRDLATLDDDQLTAMRRSTLGFVFQSFHLVAALTAQQNVALPLRLAGRRDADRIAAEALERMGLAERRGHRPRELSGGQQQRVAIARAVAVRPAMLFADEPTGALDSAAAASVLRLLRSLVDELAQTVLMVTHDPGAAAYADRVVFMRDGAIVDHLVGADAAAIAARLAELEAAA